MRFVDELLAKEKEPYNNPPPPSPSKEVIEHQKRHEYILSGAFGREIINSLKQELLNEVNAARLFQSSIERNKSKRCIYQEKEFRQKAAQFRSKYYHEEETVAEPKVRKQAYLDYYLPHCVFDKNEVEYLKKQLNKELLAEGFSVVFDIKEFHYKLCNGLGLGIKKLFYGYTVNFTVHW